MTSFMSSSSAPVSDAVVAQSQTPVTLVVVDVDGVLNVSVRDSGSAPLLLNEANIDATEQAMKHIDCYDAAYQQSIRKLSSAMERDAGEGGGIPYATFATDAKNDFADVFVQRLSSLIRAAGARRCVVLASTWRQPKHVHKLQRLEAAIAKHLGEPFVFDAQTDANEDDVSPEGRLYAVGRFLANYRTHAPCLRVLMLEDFHVSALGRGGHMESVEGAEQYLQACIPSHMRDRSSVRLCHTYERFEAPSGLKVAIGTGLTSKHFRRAAAFLAERRDSTSKGDRPSTRTEHLSKSDVPKFNVPNRVAMSVPFATSAKFLVEQRGIKSVTLRTGSFAGA